MLTARLLGVTGRLTVTWLTVIRLGVTRLGVTRLGVAGLSRRCGVLRGRRRGAEDRRRRRRGVRRGTGLLFGTVPGCAGRGVRGVGHRGDLSNHLGFSVAHSSWR